MDCNFQHVTIPYVHLSLYSSYDVGLHNLQDQREQTVCQAYQVRMELGVTMVFLDCLVPRENLVCLVCQENLEDLVREMDGWIYDD